MQTAENLPKEFEYWQHGDVYWRGAWEAHGETFQSEGAAQRLQEDAPLTETGTTMAATCDGLCKLHSQSWHKDILLSKRCLALTGGDMHSRSVTCH